MHEAFTLRHRIPSHALLVLLEKRFAVRFAREPFMIFTLSGMIPKRNRK